MARRPSFTAALPKSWLQPGWGGAHEAPPLAETLLVCGRGGRSVFFRNVATGRLPMLGGPTPMHIVKTLIGVSELEGGGEDMVGGVWEKLEVDVGG